MKYFVLDTNVLLHDAESLLAFGDNTVVIPIDVLEELDKFKGQNNEIGRNAREVVRCLDRLRERGRLTGGVNVNGGPGKVQVDLQPVSLGGLGLSKDVPDNRIISVAYRLQEEGKNVIFVSKDINVRIKSDALGITTMDFEKEKVNIERLYTGWCELQVSPEELHRFKEQGTLEVEAELHANQFVLLRANDSPKSSKLGRRSFDDPQLVEALRWDQQTVCGVRPRNLQQTLAMDLLLDDRVKLVTLVGQAGTGKTLVALACGLKKVVQEGEYEKLLVSRPIMPLGRDIGYLPGTKDEKLEQWMKPIFDNIKFLLHHRRDSGWNAPKRVKDLLSNGVLEMEALTYIRGRSIFNQFLIVDEAQNLTPHEVKTIISRAGEETKLVLTGDPFQIDNPYLDSNSNGLTYVAERMKEQCIAGHVLMRKSERSELASVAAEIL